MDLSKQPPRRPSNLAVAGIVALARMTDKARAHNAELLGEYKYGEDSGLDREVLAFINMTAAEFADAAGELDDSALGARVLARAHRSPEEIAAFNGEHLQREPQDQLHVRLLQERLARFAPGRTDIRTVFASMELDDWGCFRDLDLTKQPPRTPYLRSVAGVVAAARMADKARATRAGLNGEYTYGNSSGIDRQVLDFLDIGPDEFMEAAYSNPNDAELTEWVTAHTGRTGPEVSAFNAELSARGKYPPVRERFLARRAQICPDCDGVETWFDLIDVDDQQSFGVIDLTRRPPRSPYDRSLGGICGLARLVDKGRAQNAGLLGYYWFGADSGADRQVLAFLGLSADAFVAALQQHSTDAAVVAWLGDRLTVSEAQKQEFNGRIQAAGPADETQRACLRREVARLDPARTDIQCWYAWMLLDDQITCARLRSGV